MFQHTSDEFHTNINKIILNTKETNKIFRIERMPILILHK